MHCVPSVELFGDNNKGSCFKSVDICRVKRRAYERTKKMSYIMSAGAAVEEIYIDTFSNEDDVDATKKVASPFAKISSPLGLSRFSDVSPIVAGSSAAATSADV